MSEKKNKASIMGGGMKIKENQGKGRKRRISNCFDKTWIDVTDWHASLLFLFAQHVFLLHALLPHTHTPHTHTLAFPTDCMTFPAMAFVLYNIRQLSYVFGCIAFCAGMPWKDSLVCFKRMVLDKVWEGRQEERKTPPPLSSLGICLPNTTTLSMGGYREKERKYHRRQKIWKASSNESQSQKKNIPYSEILFRILFRTIPGFGRIIPIPHYSLTPLPSLFPLPWFQPTYYRCVIYSKIIVVDWWFHIIYVNMPRIWHEKQTKTGHLTGVARRWYDVSCTSSHSSDHTVITTTAARAKTKLARARGIFVLPAPAEQPFRPSCQAAYSLVLVIKYVNLLCILLTICDIVARAHSLTCAFICSRGSWLWLSGAHLAPCFNKTTRIMSVAAWKQKHDCIRMWLAASLKKRAQ